MYAEDVLSNNECVSNAFKAHICSHYELPKSLLLTCYSTDKPSTSFVYRYQISAFYNTRPTIPRKDLPSFETFGTFFEEKEEDILLCAGLGLWSATAYTRELLTLTDWDNGLHTCNFQIQWSSYPAVTNSLYFKIWRGGEHRVAGTRLPQTKKILFNPLPDPIFKPPVHPYLPRHVTTFIET